MENPVNHYYASRPSWLSGQISLSDARFLFKETVAARTELVVEIGTASGFSAGIICLALDALHSERKIGPDFRVYTYDVRTTWYRDESRLIGHSVREQLPPHLLARINFRNPAQAIDAALELPADGVRFAFIDANHEHPWPALDLLALLPCLAPAATVLLHDINLPTIDPAHPSWGAKYLFDDLSIEKRVPSDEEIPNIGAIVLPADKASLRKQILHVVAAHPWGKGYSPPQRLLEALGVATS